ncbi:MAG: PSD1 and planctomycete cytochrome C domain-containing protein, partial [Acidobacteriota bacterium]|nr:PSD1 and planctomycete cytochrome C domain-containing protein [Acidobacteriota bacterium]
MKTSISTRIITTNRTKLGLCAVWVLMPLFVYAASQFAPPASVTEAAESLDQRPTHQRFSARPLTANSFTNVAPAQAPIQSKSVDFNRDIKPIFEASCYQCHAGEKAKAQFRVDVKAAALAGGISGPAITPGHSKDSLLLQRVLGLGDQPRMPPVGDPLSKEQIEMLRAWIDQGAVWPDAGGQTTASAAGPAKHWAYVKPVRPTIPTNKNVSWPRNSIDNFILARLEKENLAPSPEASKEVLIRRVTLDITGLPPSVKEVDDFVADRAPDAYEKVVDRLLTSPHYGERWARPWLDLARYADTNGFEKDNRRAMWKYRDWVIDALNKDMPFDQFTVEQIAGDMLPGATAEQKIASGFHRNAMLNEEGGVDPEEARWETNVDRVNTTSTVWLGSTLACAQCHNHKYDPFTQKDYYRLFAFFENIDYKLEGDAVISEVKLREPKFETPSSEQEAKRREIDAEIAKLKETLKTQTSELENSQREWEREVSGAGASWTTLDPSALSSSGGSTLTEAADKSVTASGNNPHADTYTVEARASLNEMTALRLEVMTDSSLPRGGPGRDIYGNFTLSGISIEVAPADAPTQFQSLTFVNAVSDDGSSGVKNLVKYESDEYGTKGWSIDATKEETRFNRQAVFVTAKPFGDTREMLFKIKLKHESADGRQGIGRFRLSISSAKDPTSIANISMKLRHILDIPVEQRTEQQRKDLSGYYLSIAPQLKPTRERLAKVQKSIDALNIPSTLVMRERATSERPSTFLRVRGSFIAPGEKVYAGVPAVLHTMPDSQLPNRLGLAYWLVSEENPLVARVTVNRFWEQLFGRGMVETSEDFGAQGDTPTHPELLDWLATEFAGQRWSMKAMHRLIVTSATY